MANIIKKVFQWGIAIVLGFLIVNTLLFAYERPVGWFDTPNGVSRAIRRPGALNVHGTEGYSFSRIDDNGFINSGSLLDGNYILIMGASHTQAKEVPVEKRFSELLNAHFQRSPDRMMAYNIACDGSFLPTQIKHFRAAVSQYPDASCYLIEIGSLSYSADELKDSLNQVDYIETDSAVYFETLSLPERVKVFVKETFPLISMIKSKIDTADNEEDKETETMQTDSTGYSQNIHAALELLRSETDPCPVFLRRIVYR